MAWLFPSVIIEGCSEEEAKAVYARAMLILSRDVCTMLNNDEITVKWDEGCEKIEDAEVVNG